MNKTKTLIIGGESAIGDKNRIIMARALAVNAMVPVKNVLSDMLPSLNYKVDGGGIHITGDINFTEMSFLCTIIGSSPENFDLKLGRKGAEVTIYFRGDEEKEVSIWQTFHYALMCYRKILLDISNISSELNTKTESAIVDSIIDSNHSLN